MVQRITMLLGRYLQGRTQDFLRGGGGEFFSCIMARRVRKKSTLRKLFTVLQASSVLPHSKNIQKTDFKDFIY